MIRQTVFYTPDTLTVSAGEKITGRLSCAPNARNNRDLDIVIAYKVEDGPETEIQYKMCVLSRSFLRPFRPSAPCRASARLPARRAQKRGGGRGGVLRGSVVGVR